MFLFLQQSSFFQWQGWMFSRNEQPLLLFTWCECSFVNKVDRRGRWGSRGVHGIRALRNGSCINALLNPAGICTTALWFLWEPVPVLCPCVRHSNQMKQQHPSFKNQYNLSQKETWFFSHPPRSQIQAPSNPSPHTCSNVVYPAQQHTRAIWASVGLFQSKGPLEKALLCHLF